MPCLGCRKKKSSSIHYSEKQSLPVEGGDTASIARIKQECSELRVKNEEHLALISRQSDELEKLRQKIESSEEPESDTQKRLAEMEAQHQDTLSSLKQKEELVQQREAELEKLGQIIAQKEDLQSILDEKDRLIQGKEDKIKDLHLQWQEERAKLIKPALEGVSSQLEQLKITNEDAQRRLIEKEEELSKIRSELDRRERTPLNRGSKMNDVKDQQKRLNRLTLDLENDRLMIQKLEELNQQLEAQKKQHEAALQHHAETIAEKDRELVEHQQSLSEIKVTHHHAVKTLERNLQSSMTELKNHHEEDLKKLKLRLGHAERQAKSDMNSEVEKLLHEFEQSEHNHTQRIADLQKSHHEQLSVMKQDQQAEIQHHLLKRNTSAAPESISPSSSSNPSSTIAPLRKTGGSSGKVFRWPTIGGDHQPELIPKDPEAIHIYISSVSANSAVKRNQESIQALLDTCQVQYQIIDVARREPALQHMRRQTNGKTLQLPLIFVGGHYRGQLNDLMEAQNSGGLPRFLSKDHTSNKRTNTSRLNSHSDTSNPSQSRLPSKTMPRLKDDDESLLLELEKELASNHGLNLDF